MTSGDVAAILNCAAYPTTEADVRKHKADDWTIERWRTEPRLVGLEFSDTIVDGAPPLWKDLALASLIAVLLWIAAAVVFA